MIDTRTAQTTLENLLRDSILLALGWRMPPVSTISDLRAVATQGKTSTTRSDDDLIAVISGQSITSFRWSSVSVVSDDGATVIQPNDVGGGAPGRWVAWTSKLRFSPVVGGPSFTLDQLTSGPVLRVIVLDKDMTQEEALNLIAGTIPAVIIAADDDEPEDATLNAGHRWLTSYKFTVTVISENLRDRREAAQGSNVPGDIDPGANQLDGFIKAVIGGATLATIEEGIQVVRLGRGYNWVSDLAQRRVMRSRIYTVRVTEEFPQAPNEFGPVQDVTAQAHLDALDAAQDPFDPNNVLVAGIAVAFPVSGLTQPVTAGSAVLAGATVNYAGQSFTFASYSDTYRDLLPNGTLTFVAVPIGSPAPPVTATALRIGVTSTMLNNVTADRILAATSALYGPRYDFGAI